MKKLLLIIITTLSLVGCGGGSGDKAVSTTEKGNNGGLTRPGGTNRPPTNCTGNSCHNGSSFTPNSVGENQFPGGLIELSYDVDSAGAVDAYGGLTLDVDYGFGECLIAPGQYNIDTTNFGVRGSIAHNYRNISVEARRSNSRFSGVIENAVAMENTQGLWVQDVRLNITSVNGAPCNYLSLSFAMPVMN